MKYCKFRVDGKIKAKSRPRFNTKTGKAYKVKSDTLYENLIRQAYRGTESVRFDDNDYIRVHLDMYFAVPKSYTKTRRQKCISGSERPAKKPDV